MRKLTLLGFMCLALILTALPFMAACAEEEPAPVTPVPVTPAPVTPAPVTPAPVTPAPVTPAPTPVTPPPAPVVVPAPAGEPEYAVMDPRSYMDAIPYIGLNPRLDTVVGKKIGVANLMGGNAEALVPIAPAIMAAYPGSEAEYMEVRDYKDAAFMEWVVTCDAIILGNNY